MTWRMTETAKDIVLNALELLVTGKNIQFAESQLSKYSSLSGYGMLLLSIFCDENGLDDLIRHQSGILLKNFLIKNWESNDNIIDDKAKTAIKSLILNKSLFEDSNSKIRTTTALIISILAEFDYPEKWNNLLNIILSFINESCKNKNILLLSGSINTLSLFIEHICDLQIPSITPILFPLLL